MTKEQLSQAEEYKRLSPEEKKIKIQELLDQDEHGFDGADYAYRKYLLEILGYDTTSGITKGN